MNTEVLVKKVKRVSKKKLTLYVIATIFLTFIIITGISLYVGWKLTHPKAQQIIDHPGNYGLSYQDITFLSQDGETKLNGWVIEPAGKVKMNIIFSHGYRKNRYHDTAGFLSLSKELVEAGYRVVMFDYRNSGNSEGSLTTVGVKEKDDLMGAITWTNTHFNEPIGLYGGSMGAATALLAAEGTEQVTAVVADSPFSNLKDYLGVNLSVWSKLPNFPFTSLILFLLPAVLDIDLEQANPLQALENISQTPVLFIHGDKDNKIPHAESIRMQKENPQLFQIWIPKGAGHVGAYKLYQKEYSKRVMSFYENTLHTVENN